MIRTLRALVLWPLLVFSAQACSDKPASTAPAAHAGHTLIGPATALPAQRWKADAPLRAGMARVRVATDALAHLEHGQLDSAQVTGAADEIRSAVNAMFSECRLAPDPDAALHPLLARLLVASQAMRDAPTQAAPLAELKDVLLQYGKLFDESGESVAPN